MAADLPAPLAQAVRIASVPPTLRALVRRLDRYVALDDEAIHYPVIAQILKLAELEAEHIELHVERAAGFTGVPLGFDNESHALDLQDLEEGLGSCAS